MKARTIVLNAKAGRLPVGPGGFTELKCLDCGAPLEVHQPDHESPDRLVATCTDHCGGWHLIDCSARARGGFVLRLPSPADVETAYRAGR